MNALRYVEPIKLLCGHFDLNLSIDKHYMPLLIIGLAFISLFIVAVSVIRSIVKMDAAFIYDNNNMVSTVIKELENLPK